MHIDEITQPASCQIKILQELSFFLLITAFNPVQHITHFSFVYYDDLKRSEQKVCLFALHHVCAYFFFLMSATGTRHVPNCRV